MQPSQIETMRACTALSASGGITFPQVVARLIEAEVEYYHADLTRHQTAYYLPSGDSHVEHHTLPDTPIAAEFDSTAVSAAIASIQQQQILYPEFVRLIRAAGCAGYFVHIRGRRAVYYGRTGDNHVEHFPPAR